jgi:hypothetical protein
VFLPIGRMRIMSRITLRFRRCAIIASVRLGPSPFMFRSRSVPILISPLLMTR